MKANRGLRQWVCAASLAIVVVVAANGAAFGQGTTPLVQDDLFNGTEKFAKGASDVTEVTMDPDTLGLVDGKDAKRAHGMVLNVVRTYEYDKPGMYRIEDVEEFRRKLNTGDWHCSVHTRDLKSGESTDICNRHRTDGLIEQAIITVEPKELTFIHTIKHPSDRSGADHKGDAGDGSTLLMVPGFNMPGMDAKMAAMEATMAAKGPEMEAMGAVMQARMAALQPEMEARMAGFAERFQALPALPALDTKELEDKLKAAQKLGTP